MIRVRISQPSTVRLVLQPGDEIHQRAWSPELRAFVESSRLDGLHVAEVVEDEEYALAEAAPEQAVMRRGGRRGGGSEAA